MRAPEEDGTLTQVPYSRCSVEAPDRHHFCQIHHREETLVDAVTRFTVDGLHAGEIGVVVAPEERLQKILAQLDARGVDVQAAIRAGRLVVDRADAVCAASMRNGKLDHDAFRDAFRATFDLGGPRQQIRLYGEVSNKFWHDGDVRTALTLERLATEALDGRRIAVFCGYLLDGLDRDSYRTGLEGLCNVHCCLPETADDERLRNAVDAASKEILGIPLSVTLAHSDASGESWQSRLPLARRTVLWLQANAPSAMIRVLERARHYYA